MGKENFTTAEVEFSARDQGWRPATPETASAESEALLELDLRIPIGLLFGLLGLILFGYGLATGAATYERSLGINVNAWAGAGMLLFGFIMLGSARLAARRRGPGQLR